MKAFAKKIILLACVVCLNAVLYAQSASWGDGTSTGHRESASTDPSTPGWMALDGDAHTAWALTTGSSSGWLEVLLGSSKKLQAMSVDATIPEGVVLQVSALKDGHWLPLAGGRITGPVDDAQTLDLSQSLASESLGSTDRYLVTIEGDRASEAKIRELSPVQSAYPAPYVKIAPKSYTFNQDEYINLKASRLWDGIAGNAWFEPLWSFPWEVFQTNDANKPTKIFPPYYGNPPKDAEIIWTLDGQYKIQTLKVSILSSQPCVRFEFWNGSEWANAQAFGLDWKGSGPGWRRIDLAQPVSTDKIRITFPHGWEGARYIGELEVWGSGQPEPEVRSLALSPVGSDGTRLFSVDAMASGDWSLEAVADAASALPLSGDWNGHAFSIPATTWLKGETVYRLAVDRAWLRDDTQFLRLKQAASVSSVRLVRGYGPPGEGRIDLGWPYSDGIIKNTQAGPGTSIPSWTSHTWDLKASYALENIRVYGTAAASLSLKTGHTEKLGANKARTVWTPASWTDQGDGWWEARLHGTEADTIELDSGSAATIGEVQLSGTPLADTKIGMEIWWPSSKTVSSDNNDGNSVIGWMGDPDVTPLVNGYHPRQADKIFWMPLSQMGMGPDEDLTLSLQGSKGTESFQKDFPIRWWKNAWASFDQGEDFLATSAGTLTISGGVRNPQVRVFVDGAEVTLYGGKYSIQRGLQDGYQAIQVEAWDHFKKIRLASWTKEVYKVRGDPILSLDLPHGDVFTQDVSFTLTGRVGNGPGLSLTVNGKTVPISANAFSLPVNLSEGTQTFAFALTDSLGRKTSQTLSLLRDSTPPVINIDAPLENQYLRQSSVNLTVSAAGEKGLWWKVNDEGWAYDPDHPHTTTYSLADGSYHYDVKAQDRAGNVSETKSVDFMVDATPPEAFSIQANVSGWTANPTPIISFATKDATSGIDHYEYSVDASDWSMVTSPCTLSRLADGSHQVFVRALDKAGNSRVEELTIYTDVAAPLPFAATVNVSGWTPNNRPTLSFSTSDATSGVDHYEVEVDGGSWTTQASPYVVPTLADGTHILTVRALDKAGNVTTAAPGTVSIDATPPLAFAATVNVSGWTSNNRPTLSFSTTDAMSGLDHYETAIDGGSWAAQASPYVVPALADGTHSLAVRALDRAGNAATAAALTVYIDTTPPVAVQNFRLIPGTDSMETLWATTDSDVAVYHLRRTEGSSTTASDTTVTDITDQNLSPGTMLSYQVQPEDRAGNLGPWSSADAAIAGIAVKTLPEAGSTAATLVEFKNVKLAVAPSSLPPEVKAVMINEVESDDLVQKSVNPIVGPIYSFSSLEDDGKGNLVEATHTEFQHEVMVVLHYDDSLVPNGFPESDLGVYYYDTLWSKWFRVEKAAIDISTNTIVFLTNHFTDFSVQPTLITDLKPQELKDAGHSPYKSESRAGEVTVSPQGGTMMTEATEFVLHGKNGFSLPVKRIYDSQTARVDSPSLNLSMSLGLNISASMPASIKEQLISGGIHLVASTIVSKLSEMFQKNGDYPLALGAGWRLNFPYVMASDTTVLVRLPDGCYYPVNQMEMEGGAPIVSGMRSLTFENHNGEDFTFKVHQLRINVSGQIQGVATKTAEEALRSLLKLKSESDGDISVLGMVQLAASFIPGWNTIASELITKDGTSYLFDYWGRVTRISDPSGTNVVHFDYNGFELAKIVDPLGNETTFQYNDQSQGLFLRPCITKITTPSSEGRTRSCSYEYDSSDIIKTSFKTLPPMIAAYDVDGRKTSYGIDFNRFLFSGGGSAKVNFIAAIANLIPGLGDLNNALGLYTLTISGQIRLEWPFLTNRIEAPGLGITEISYVNQDLSTFDVRPTDFFMGISWLPTAVQLSYDFLFRVVTQSVTIRNGGLAKTTSYTYHFTPRESQWLVDRTTINDGLTIVTQNYSIYSRTYNRYVSFDDAALAALKQGVFTSQSNTEEEYYPLATSTTTSVAGSGSAYETQNTGWYTNTMRPLSRTTSRGSSFTKTESYAYDNWGNATKVSTAEVTPQGGTSLTRESWYLGTSSSLPSGFPGGYPESPAQKVSAATGLLLGTKTTASRPTAYFSGPDITYQANAYDASSRPVWQGLWTGDHWAASTTDYYPVTADFDGRSGRVKESVSPTGHKTDYVYDFDSGKSKGLYFERKTEVAVLDPRGQSSDVTSETAYDLGTGWPRLQKTPEGYVTETRYDALGRPTSIISPGDEAASGIGAWPESRVNAPWDRVAYDDNARTTTLYRDTASGGNPSPTVSAPSEFYEYDNRGNLVKISKYERSQSPATTSVTQASYDAYDRVRTMTDPLGHTTTYAYDFISRPLSEQYADGTSVAYGYDDSTGRRTKTDERGTVTLDNLDWNGKPEVSTADASGLALITTTAYDGLGRESAKTDPLGQTTLTTYSVFGKPSLVQHPDLTVTEPPASLPDSMPSLTNLTVQPEELTSYDDEGRPIVAKTGYEGHWRTSSLSYDSLGRTIKENKDDRETWTWYDGSGHAIRQSDGEQTRILKAAPGGSDIDASGARFTLMAYTSRGQLATQTDQLGAVTTYAYDRNNRKILMRDPRAQGARAEDFSIHYAYDDLGRLVSADLPPVTGQTRGAVTIQYDLRGNPVRRTDPDGKVTTWTYDARNRKTSQTLSGSDGKSLITAWAYDEAGNQTAEIVASSLNAAAPGNSPGLATRKTYDRLNRVTLVTLPDGEETHSQYDSLGRVTESRDANGYATTYAYNSQNKVTRETMPEGKTTKTAYNTWGDPTSATLEGADSGTQVWVRGYNNYSQVTYEKNNAGQTWTHEYDLRGLETRRTDPNGTAIATTYSLTGLPIARSYAKAGQSQSEAWTYDEAGALKAGSDGAVSTTINQQSGTYVADPYGLVTSYLTTAGGQTLAWSQTYDKAQRPTSLTYPDGSAISYQYDSLGELIAIPGYASDGEYNYMGRLTSLSAANGTGRTKTWDSSKGTLEAYEWTGTGSAPRSLTWDNRGNLASQTKDSYSGRYQYDGQNRLVYSDEGWPVETSTKGGANTNYGTRERDVGGRKSLDFGNPTATLKFDYAATSVGVNLGQIESVNKVRLGRTSPRVSARTLEVYVSKIGTAGTWTKVENTTLITDQSGTTIQLKAPEDAQFVKIHSAWDERNSDNESVDNSSVTGKPDDLIEVWSTVNGQATSYSYDGLGNRLSTTTNTAGTTSATYYPNTNTVKTNGIWEYNYDPNGNLISRGTEGSWDDSAKSYTWSATSGELWNYAYDLKNRLVEVKHSTAGSGGLRLVADYSYDMRDLRVVTTKPEGTTYYQYDTSGDLIWKSEAGNSTKYIQALGETWAEVRSTASGSATYYHHTDHEGSTELITDANGKVVWSGSYEAFGKLSRSNGGLEFDASYTGKQVDPDTGLYYFNARWYDPNLGRFITEDPVRDDTNWYVYCSNNPLNRTDPTGLEQNMLQKLATKALSYASKNSPIANVIIKDLTKISIQRSSDDNGENGKYFKSSESVTFMGIPLNRIDVQSTADYTSEVNAGNGRTIPAGEYKGTLLNKSGSYNDAISITGNGVSESEAVLAHPNSKTAKGATTEYANGERPFSAACQISHLDDFNEVTGILKDVGFNYGSGDAAWAKGDTVRIDIAAPRSSSGNQGN